MQCVVARFYSFKIGIVFGVGVSSILLNPFDIVFFFVSRSTFHHPFTLALHTQTAKTTSGHISPGTAKWQCKRFGLKQMIGIVKWCLMFGTQLNYEYFILVTTSEPEADEKEERKTHFFCYNKEINFTWTGHPQGARFASRTKQSCDCFRFFYFWCAEPKNGLDEVKWKVFAIWKAYLLNIPPMIRHLPIVFKLIWTIINSLRV